MLLTHRIYGLLIPAAFLGGLLPGHCQTHTAVGIGPQIGFNVSTGGYQVEGGPFTPKALAGFEAGVAFQIRRAHWALQPALLYAQKGFVLRENTQIPNPYGAGSLTENDYLKYRLNYITIPLSLIYAQKADVRGLQGFVGGYISRLLGGKLDYDYSLVRPDFSYAQQGSRDIKPSRDYSNDGKEHFQPFDAGLRFGFGYSCSNLAFQAGYTAGLLNTWAPRDGNVTYKNKAFFATATYFIPTN